VSITFELTCFLVTRQVNTAAHYNPPQRKSLGNIKSLATQATVENTELADLPQRASDIDTVVKQLFTESGTNTDGLPLRDLLALDEASRCHRGAIIDNLAKLDQLDTDIANAEHELDGAEAADPAKNSRIEQLLSHLHNERAARLEAASVNREALRSQISRIRETVTRHLNDNTTLPEHLRTLFREHGVTIASLLAVLGFIISTVVLAIQNTLGGGGRMPAPSPTTPSEHGAATKDPRWLAESPCQEGVCGAAWNYWCHRLMASENRR